jgi:hypothetical protein
MGALGMTAKDVANAMERTGFAFRRAKQPHRIVESWISKSRPYHPELLTAVALVRVLNTTVEELVDGENGAEYVRQIVRPKLPPRIAAIVEDLMMLDDKELDIIQAAAHTAAEAKKGKSTGTNGLPG